MSSELGQDFPNEPALDELRDRLQGELCALQVQLDRLRRLFSDRQGALAEPERRPERLLLDRRASGSGRF